MCDPEFFTPVHVQAPASTSFDDDSNASGSDDELSKRKSTLKVTEDVVTFRRALYAWRLETAEAKYGAHIVAIYGSHMIMSDAMIDRVIACAKASKLPTVQHLVKETGWREDLANKYGESLLTVVRQRCDKKTATANSNGENVNPVTREVPSTSAATRVMHCSKCGKPGHNRMAIFSFSPFLFFNLHFKGRSAKCDSNQVKKTGSSSSHIPPSQLPPYQASTMLSVVHPNYLQLPSQAGTSNQSNQLPVIAHNSNDQVNSNSTHNSRMFSLE